MNLFISKKATHIYRAIISLFLLAVVIPTSWADEELASFCFKPATSLAEARDSLQDLLLPREKVFLRPEQRCMDVLTSPNRVKLLEKFLRLRYTLVVDETERESTALQNQHCQLELKKTTNQQATNSNVQLGLQNQVSAGASTLASTETSQLLLGLGKPGVLAIGTQALYVECRRGATGIYQLTFSLQENGSSRITSEVSTRANEMVNVGQVTKELNDKNKILGVPQTAVSTAIGNEETLYQLQVKN